MKERMLYKSLVIGIVILFVSLGIQPAFADDTENMDYVSTDNSNPINQGVYENFNCFVIGVTSHAGKWPYFLYNGGFKIKNILFKVVTFGLDYPGTRIWSNGWLYTNGEQGNWTYEGKFIGQLGYTYPGFLTGITDFVGLNIGRFFSYFQEDFDTQSFFIGYARHVKIKGK